MITLMNGNLCIELLLYSVIEVLENRGNLGFISDKEDLGKTGMIINKGHKLLFPKGGIDLEGTPNITMDKGERLGWYIWL